jgi:hypothetical protein
MKTFSHLWQYHVEFFSAREMFQIKVVEIIKIHILCPVLPPPPRKSCRYDKTSKNMVEAEWTETTWRLRVAFWVSKQAHAGDRAPTSSHTHTHIWTHKHALTSPPPPAHTHTHTEMCNIDCFPWQQWFREGASMWSYTYIVYFILMPWIPCIFVQLHLDPTKCTTFTI